MTNAEDIYEKLMKDDYSVFKNISSQASHDVHVQLAEHLVGVFSRQQKLSPLLSWAIRNEVENAKQYNLILREDSLNKALVNRVLFDNVGIKYLKLLLTPMIEKVCESERTLEIAPHKVGEKEADDNLKLLLDALDIFVTTFQDSEMSCPLIIRKLLMYLHCNIAEKFKDQGNEIPFSLHFFFFQYLCLALTTPEKFTIVDPSILSESKTTGLLNISKLLKDLAGGTVRDGESPLFHEFQKKRRVVLMETFESLIDPKAIQTAERILLANTTAAKVRPEDIQYYKNSFIKFISDHGLDEITSSMSSYSKSTASSENSYEELESPETAKLLAEKLMEKLSNPNWKLKKKKSSNKFAVSVLREKSENAISVRIEFIVSAPLKDTVDFYHEQIWNPHYDSAVTDPIISYQGQDYRECYFKFKMPFPLSNRDFSFSEWLVHSSPTRVIELRKSNKCYPQQSGYVRAKALLNGAEYEKIDADGVEKTKVRMILHCDPCGSVPKWLAASVALAQSDKIFRMKKDLESKMSRKGN